MTRNQHPSAVLVRLCAVQEADLPLLFEWINDRDTALLNSAYAPVHFANHVDWFNAARRRSDVVLFAIRALADDRLVGTCQLHSIHPVYCSAELQIRIGSPGDRGKGYGSDAVYQLLRHGFDDRNLHRIGLHVFSDNQPAIRLYTKAGFKDEGRLREAAFIDGRFKDVLLFGLLRKDFQGK